MASLQLSTALSVLLDAVHNISEVLGDSPSEPITYTTMWVLGVVLSCLLIVALVLWAVFQSRLRARFNWHRRQRLFNRDEDLSVQFVHSAVPLAQSSVTFTIPTTITTTTPCDVTRAIASLSLAHSKRETLALEFNVVSLTLLTGKRVLQSVSGALMPRTMTAILGPSGCGKTSLLTALAGRAYYGTMAGSVLINGRDEPLTLYRTVLGFVPQEDTMIRTLTVRQVLSFSARMRLPREMTDAEVRV
jgi:ABC-type multidrug transport system fused ATPase/permease subunit